MLIAILRVIQFILGVIVLGLTSYSINIANTVYGDSTNTVNFNLFVAIWTILALAYLTLAPLLLPRYHHKYAVLSVESLTVLLWFAGWVSLAALIGGASCDALYENITRACQAAKAATAMGALSWIAWVVTLVFVIRSVRN